MDPLVSTIKRAQNCSAIKSVKWPPLDFENICSHIYLSVFCVFITLKFNDDTAWFCSTIQLKKRPLIHGPKCSLNTWPLNNTALSCFFIPHSFLDLPDMLVRQNKLGVEWKWMEKVSASNKPNHFFYLSNSIGSIQRSLQLQGSGLVMVRLNRESTPLKLSKEWRGACIRDVLLIQTSG